MTPDKGRLLVLAAGFGLAVILYLTADDTMVGTLYAAASVLASTIFAKALHERLSRPDKR